MATLKPFRAYRPVKDLAHLVASVPYDVISSEEAREVVKGNPISFLHIIRPEIDFPREKDPYAPEVYRRAEKNFNKALEMGLFHQDHNESFYIYMLEKEGHQQTGIVGCASIEDYFNEVILKHELTRPDKEEDRKNHVRATNMNAEPVFFAYRAVEKLDEIMSGIKKTKPAYDFIAPDEVRHVVWQVSDPAMIQTITAEFEKIENTYVADGHHRTAAAALVGRELRNKNPHHQGIEEYNYFLAVHFPHDQLRIIDYNRVVKDLNGLSEKDFLTSIEKKFDVRSKGKSAYAPQKPHEFSMYLDGKWYQLKTRKGVWDEKDPVDVLDVTILYKQILHPILGIGDLRKDQRIEFVGGIRGLEELKRRVDNKEMKVAFALYPVSMDQLMSIADSGQIMPPKTTWFEPKLRSGLFVHMLS